MPVRVALLEPVGDAGIAGYTHELAQALVTAGAEVDCFGLPSSFARTLHRDYRLYAALGLPAADAAWRLPAPAAPPAPAPPRPEPALAPYLDRLARWRPRATVTPPPPPSHVPAAAPPAAADDDWLRRLRPYDLVWSQWPELPGATPRLWALAAAAGLPLAHTVHNVLPHEATPDAPRRTAALYAGARALVVHSDTARAELERRFPGTGARALRMAHGLYTIYPRRPGRRAAVRALLGVDERTGVLLAFGGVRPYKNLDALVDALATARRRDLVLLVAGWEWGYPDLVPGDRLGRLRRRVDAAGLGARIRLLPGPFGIEQTAELFEACDVVALPYRESSGSGQLLMALSYGRHVLYTDVGGMGEYLGGWPAATRVDDPGVTGIAGALDRMDWARSGRRETVPHLEWAAIAAETLPRLVDAVRPRPSPPAPRTTRGGPAPFLLFSLRRSGSTTLMRVLNLCPGVRCMKEPFNPLNFEGAWHARALAHDGLPRAVEAIHQTHTGIKHVCEPDGWPFPGRPDLNGQLLCLEGQRVVFLRRRNVLQRVVSNEISGQTQVWTPLGPAHRERVATFAYAPVREAVVAWHLDHELAQLQAWEAQLVSRGGSLLAVEYEALYDPHDPARRRAVLAEILRFLEVRPPDDPDIEARITGHLDPAAVRLNSEATYRRIPGIQAIADRYGSERTGWLFEPAPTAGPGPYQMA